jgi:electron-transferring-flavoprotein dehydrogenase
MTSSSSGRSGRVVCAIRLKQLQPDLNVCVLEKSATVGAHALSGAVIEPGPIDELVPAWRDEYQGICVPAGRDEFAFLTRTRRYKLPTPPQMNNHGNFIVSLGNVVTLLGREGRSAGRRRVRGLRGSAAAVRRPVAPSPACASATWVSTRTAQPGDNFAPGPEIRAKHDDRGRGLPRQHLEATHQVAFGSTPANRRRPTASVSRSCGSYRQVASSLA